LNVIKAYSLIGVDLGKRTHRRLGDTSRTWEVGDFERGTSQI